MRLALPLVLLWVGSLPCLAQNPTASDTAGAAAPATIPQQPSGDPRPGSLPVPEPSTLFLVGTGLVGVALTGRMRRRQR